MNGKSGRMIVVTAPSGSGKTTIVRHLLSKYPQLSFSVSATTRMKRPGERHGVHYYFLTREEFEKKIEAGDFIEWEEVYTGQYYGTLRAEVERLWGEGKTVLFDIDVKGAESIKASFPHNTLVIFIKVPSIETIIERLEKRDTESEQSLQKRISKMKTEWSYASRFDHVLINDDLSEALKNAERIVEASLEAVNDD